MIKIPKEVLAGLQELGSLSSFSARGIKFPADFQKPFEELFKLATQRMKLGGRDTNLIEPLKKAGYENAATWVQETDKKHTIASLSYLVNICNDERYPQDFTKRIISAMICHDCAYPKTLNFKDFTSKKNRKLHMICGAEAFKNFAIWINNSFPDFYSLSDVEDISSIISKHDNPGIGQKFSLRDPKLYSLLVHREADRLWMLDRAGFALDLVRRIVEKDQYDPQNYLLGVVCSHIKEGCKYNPEKYFWFKRYLNAKTLYTTDKGFEIFKEELEKRIAEYKINRSGFEKKLKDTLEEKHLINF